ncbi:hypothetical protein Q4602_00965 [Paraglaciecola chathamensis]|uniref:hypothetical protein n=1 Tax=Paraglaciecola chathamensis TaxID=368405 RepID=UPI00270A4BAA|nr:hypothetical protein [Paraglaciecola chathamensis]MDO6838030.1 hypothetical protein [Paraglaciecola chathamensis]
MHIDPVSVNYYSDPTEILSRMRAKELFSENEVVHFCSFPWCDFVIALESAPSLARFLMLKLRSAIARNLNSGDELVTVCALPDMSKVVKYMFDLGVTRVFNPYWSPQEDLNTESGITFSAMPLSPDSLDALNFKRSTMEGNHFYYVLPIKKIEPLNHSVKSKELNSLSTDRHFETQGAISSGFSYVLIDRASENYLIALWSAISAECIPIVISKETFEFSFNNKNVELWKRAIINVPSQNSITFNLDQLFFDNDFINSQNCLDAVLCLKKLYGSNTFLYDVYIESIRYSDRYIKEFRMNLLKLTELNDISQRLFSLALSSFILKYKRDRNIKIILKLNNSSYCRIESEMRKELLRLINRAKITTGKCRAT